MLITFRIVSILAMGGAVLLVVPLYFVVPPETYGPSVAPVGWLAGVAGLVVVLGLVTELVGYRAASAVPRGLPPEQVRGRSAGTFAALAVARAALAVVPVPVALACAFLTPYGGFVLYAVGAAGTIGLLAVHGWPGERAVSKVERSLERDGGTSVLRPALGLRSATRPPPRPAGTP